MVSWLCPSIADKEGNAYFLFISTLGLRTRVCLPQISTCERTALLTVIKRERRLSPQGKERFLTRSPKQIRRGAKQLRSCLHALLCSLPTLVPFWKQCSYVEQAEGLVLGWVSSSLLSDSMTCPGTWSLDDYLIFCSLPEVNSQIRCGELWGEQVLQNAGTQRAAPWREEEVGKNYLLAIREWGPECKYPKSGEKNWAWSSVCPYPQSCWGQTGCMLRFDDH